MTAPVEGSSNEIWSGAPASAWQQGANVLTSGMSLNKYTKNCATNTYDAE